MGVTKVRFNLGRGENYKKWKVTYPDGSYEHFDPKTHSLVIHDARLKNNRKSAERIFNGHNKFVCAWIECEGITVRKRPGLSLEICNIARVRYNPRKHPYWVSTSKDINVDDKYYEELLTIGTDVYVWKA